MYLKAKDGWTQSDMDAQGGLQENTEAETGVTRLQAKEHKGCQQPPEAGRKT